MPWNGYNFEDSDPASASASIAEDRYTSIHIEELVVDGARHQARRRRRSPATSRTCPSSNWRRLDESGIVDIGAEVEPGRRAGGQGHARRARPARAPEEKLLRAIFGEKASNVKDTSLHVDQGTAGTVIDVQVFTREGIPARQARPADHRRRARALSAWT